MISRFIPAPNWALIITFLLGLGLGLGFNRILEWYQAQPNQKLENAALRLEGFTFVNPLLACDFEPDQKSLAMQRLETQLNQYIEQKAREEAIDTASVYLRYYRTGEAITVNPEERYYPASLNKIPMLITAYKMAETQPNFLTQSVIASGSGDYNAAQEITPKETITFGKTYTIEAFLDKLIKYSDNNSFYALSRVLDPALFEKTFQDLKIPQAEANLNPQDYMTVSEFAYFLRVLFNATYLSRTASEQALSLLSQSDYKDGIVAGVPAGIPVAHKFGLFTQYTQGQPTLRELHDCGIIYSDNKPFLLCVMTKSRAPLPTVQSVIRDIAKQSYEAVRQW